MAASAASASAAAVAAAAAADGLETGRGAMGLNAAAFSVAAKAAREVLSLLGLTGFGEEVVLLLALESAALVSPAAGLATKKGLASLPGVVAALALALAGEGEDAPEDEAAADGVETEAEAAAPEGPGDIGVTGLIPKGTAIFPGEGFGEAPPPPAAAPAAGRETAPPPPPNCRAAILSAILVPLSELGLAIASVAPLPPPLPLSLVSEAIGGERFAIIDTGRAPTGGGLSFGEESLFLFKAAILSLIVDIIILLHCHAKQGNEKYCFNNFNENKSSYKLLNFLQIEDTTSDRIARKKYKNP